MTQSITLSLISHTNVGKTTLARTLLRRDVGEVLDQAHVTEVSEAHELISIPSGELLLWDTPGFGDSVRLLRRLQRQDRPVVWFVQQLWDKVTDRPLWCSQQAVLNIRQEADVVLYLVNATEDPLEAGYVTPELELLSWMGRPVIVLLNQLGDGGGEQGRAADRVEVWRQHTARWPQVKEVMTLDAFSRCWVQESLLLDRVVDVLPEEKQAQMRLLKNAWDARNLAIFERATEAMADYLAAVAADRQALPERRGGGFRLSVPETLRKEEKRQAMEALGKRLETSTHELMTTLIQVHGLEGRSVAEIDRQLDAFLVEGEDLLNPEKSALLGSVVSGAVGGLAADVLSGGLTFGGGLVAGAILGALGGAGLARGYQMVKGEKQPAVSWAPPFLDRLVAQVLLRYLAVAHFGRGKGEFRQQEASEHWKSSVARALRRRPEEWRETWQVAIKTDDPSAAAQRLQPILFDAAAATLVASYPEAEEILAVESVEEEPEDRWMVQNTVVEELPDESGR